MMANNKKKIFDKLNPVEGFNPAAYLETIIGEDGKEAQLLSVQNRVMWFRMVYKLGQINTEVVPTNVPDTVVVKATVCADDGTPLASGMGSGNLHDTLWGTRAVECAETKAIGRALANAGFGTQYCQDLDTQPNNLPDAPHAVSKEEVPKQKNNYEIEKSVAQLCANMTTQVAQQTMLASGRFSGEVVLDVIEMASEDGRRDKVEYLREYAYPTNYAGLDVNDIAACRVMVDAFDKKYPLMS